MFSSGDRTHFEPTSKQRQRVEKLAALGWTREQIALEFGMFRPTLRKYFGDELFHGRAQCRHTLISCMWKVPLGGRVSAILWLEERTRESPLKPQP
jgi:hypothetical protein